MTTTMTKRGAMTGYLSRAGGVTAVTLAVTMAAVAAPMLSPGSASAQVRMTVPPQSQPVALQGATIHTVTNGVIENGTRENQRVLSGTLGGLGRLVVDQAVRAPALLVVGSVAGRAEAQAADGLTVAEAGA